MGASRGRRWLPLPGLLGLLLFLFVPQTVSLFTFGVEAFDPANGAVRAEVAGEPIPDAAPPSTHAEQSLEHPAAAPSPEHPAAAPLPEETGSDHHPGHH